MQTTPHHNDNDSTPSLERRRKYVAGPFPADNHVPSARSLTGAVCAAVDDHTNEHFEPLAYTPPRGWTLDEHTIGGNRDLNGHHETVRWSHPVYPDVEVASEEGADTYTATFCKSGQDDTAFHIGSRYISLLRAALAVDERDGPKPIDPIEVESALKTIRNQSYGRPSQVLPEYIDRWAGKYPTEAIIDTVDEICTKTGCQFEIRELTDYAVANTATWDELLRQQS